MSGPFVGKGLNCAIVIRLLIFVGFGLTQEIIVSNRIYVDVAVPPTMAAAAKVSKPAQTVRSLLSLSTPVTSTSASYLACYAHQEEAVYANQGPSAVLSPQAITACALTSPSYHCFRYVSVLLHSMRPGYILTHSCNAFFDSGGKFARPCRNLSWLQRFKCITWISAAHNHIKVTQSDSVEKCLLLR